MLTPPRNKTASIRNMRKRRKIIIARKAPCFFSQQIHR